MAKLTFQERIDDYSALPPDELREQLEQFEQWENQDQGGNCALDSVVPLELPEVTKDLGRYVDGLVEQRGRLPVRLGGKAVDGYCISCNYPDKLKNCLCAWCTGHPNDIQQAATNMPRYAGIPPFLNFPNPSNFE